MSWHSIKLLPADTAFSRLIRLEQKKCMMCGRLGTGDEGIFGLEASHYFGRGKWNVRYDKENVDVLCKSDHQKTHRDKTMYDNWKLEQLGQRAFDLLTLRANTRSSVGSSFWKSLTLKQAQEIFSEL